MIETFVIAMLQHILKLSESGLQKTVTNNLCFEILEEI